MALNCKFINNNSVMSHILECLLYVKYLLDRACVLMPSTLGLQEKISKLLVTIPIIAKIGTNLMDFISTTVCNIKEYWPFSVHNYLEHFLHSEIILYTGIFLILYRFPCSYIADDYTFQKIISYIFVFLIIHFPCNI